MRVTKTAVIQAASDIADEKGLNNVSLKVVAERLNIRTPSLYNHIENLDDLLREVAHNGMRTMNQRMAQAAIGKSGDTAIKAVAIEYLNYMIEHCGNNPVGYLAWHRRNCKDILRIYRPSKNAHPFLSFWNGECIRNLKPAHRISSRIYHITVAICVF